MSMDCSDSDDVRIARLVAEADQLRQRHKALKNQLEQSEAEKRRLQSKLVNPSPVARKQRDLLVQTQTEAAVLRRRLDEVTSERDAVRVTKAALQAQVAQLMELAAQAAEGQRALAMAAVVHAQLAALCHSTGAGGAACMEDASPDQQLAALCVWTNEAQQHMARMASQLHVSEASRRALEEQLLQAQQHGGAPAPGAAPPDPGAAAPAGEPAAAAASAAATAPPALLASPIDGRLDARATSTLIWGAEGVAALPFVSPSGSPAVTHRGGGGGDADADAPAGTGVRDQGAAATVAERGAEPKPASTAAEGAGPQSPEGSFATAASAGPPSQAGGAAAAAGGGDLATPASVSGPAFPGFTTPLSRLPSELGGVTPGSTGGGSGGALGMLSALRHGITPRRLLGSPRAEAEGGARGAAQRRSPAPAGGGLADLLCGAALSAGDARTSTPRRAPAGVGACPLLGPVRAGDLGVDAAGVSPLNARLMRLRQVPVLWGRPEGTEDGAAAAAAAAVRAAMAAGPGSWPLAAEGDGEGEGEGAAEVQLEPVAGQAAGAAEASEGAATEEQPGPAAHSDEEGVEQQQQPAAAEIATAAPLAMAQQQAAAAQQQPTQARRQPSAARRQPAPRRRRRSRIARLARLVAAAAVVGAAGAAARRARPDLWEAAQHRSAEAWEAARGGSATAWEAARGGSAAAWDAARGGSAAAWAASERAARTAWARVRSRVRRGGRGEGEGAGGEQAAVDTEGAAPAATVV
ncbi:MAG: hypothetical protein J3K34DRAFT_515687 [Monoraphidium minutum]|nr:MAG: hypothetical protein J3K34DRAFT_515687 [Monoraphidium minutum]